MLNIFEDARDGDFNSLLLLAAMSDLSGHFESDFLPLAHHAEERFRDFVAEEAFYKKNEPVLNAAKERGISDAVRERLKE